MSKKVLSLLLALVMLFSLSGGVLADEHPALPTLDLFEKAGAKVYRTDTDGSVVLISDGNDISVVE